MYLQDVLEDEKLLRWGRAEDVFKTCLEDVFKTSWKPTNVCWEVQIKELENTAQKMKFSIFQELENRNETKRNAKS